MNIIFPNTCKPTRPYRVAICITSFFSRAQHRNFRRQLPKVTNTGSGQQKQHHLVSAVPWNRFPWKKPFPSTFLHLSSPICQAPSFSYMRKKKKTTKAEKLRAPAALRHFKLRCHKGDRSMTKEWPTNIQTPGLTALSYKQQSSALA